ncbi:MAG TPA: tetratricopeptide repeat protein, partial [Methylophilaceae bacterium]|nr:tetratricopeptide repeat protein [Methylophilaceae bacterium]
VGVQAWKNHQNKQSLEASVRYQQLVTTPSNNLKAIQSLSAQLMDNYAGTPYAGRAAVTAAKANYAAKDSKSAKAQLQWAIDHAEEDAVQSVARLQLAAIYLDEKAYDQALKTLDKKHVGFEGLFADMKGDILAAQGKTSDAKQAYQEALAQLDAQGEYRQYVAHKLEALGG